MDPLEEARQAQKSGLLWRNKEVAQSRIRQGGYDPVEFERMGAVLLLMQDTVQAGKYLFLSGSERPDYREAIALFLRVKGSDLQTILPTLPSCVRKGVSDKFPKGVADHLVALGLPVLPPTPPEPELKRIKQSSWAGAGCAVAMLLLLTLAGIGLFSVLRLFWK